MKKIQTIVLAVLIVAIAGVAVFIALLMPLIVEFWRSMPRSAVQGHRFSALRFVG